MQKIQLEKSLSEGLVDGLKVALLDRLEFGKRLFALLRGLGDDHFAHRLDAVSFKEHMLSTAQTDALRAESEGLRSVVRGVGVRAHIENAELIRPVHDAVEVARDGSRSGLDLNCFSIPTESLYVGGRLSR